METQPNQPQAIEDHPIDPSTLHCRVPSSDTDSKLDDSAYSTNSTPASYENGDSSYVRCRVDRKGKFLAAQRMGASITDAADMAGIHRTTPYFWSKQDPEFAQAWRDSRDSLIENLEMQAFHQAMHGDRTLLMFLLKSYKPETFNQRPHSDKEQEKPFCFTDIAENLRAYDARQAAGI